MTPREKNPWTHSDPCSQNRHTSYGHQFFNFLKLVDLSRTADEFLEPGNEQNHREGELQKQCSMTAARMPIGTGNLQKRYRWNLLGPPCRKAGKKGPRKLGFSTRRYGPGLILVKVWPTEGVGEPKAAQVPSTKCTCQARGLTGRCAATNPACTNFTMAREGLQSGSLHPPRKSSRKGLLNFFAAALKSRPPDGETGRKEPARVGIRKTPYAIGMPALPANL